MKTWFIPVCFGIAVGYLLGKTSVHPKQDLQITVKDSIVFPSTHEMHGTDSVWRKSEVRYPQGSIYYTNIGLWGPNAEKEREKYISYQ